jgi:dienelactone hydrolase
VQFPFYTLFKFHIMKKLLRLILNILILSFFCNFTYGQARISEKDIFVLKEPADTMMKCYLTKLVDRQFAVRDSLLSTFKSAKDWDARAQTIRDSMISWTGPFPERTPLNPQITERIEREDYIIEKVLFESRPNYFISANLYLPKNITDPCPAHLNVIGHAKIGKADERYQRMSIAQAKNGFVVLTIDQLGQGERQVKEYSSWGGAPGNAHQIIGIKAFISGTHVFNFMVWDAIRAVDYLISRREVDSNKICMTGSSGGGMMTTYILPFDDRIAVAVPTCNPNTWSYRVHANLATDHEQVFFGAFESSIDPRGDPLFAQVPKPMLLNTTTDDNLNPPRGVWDLSTWLYKSYAAHGVPEKVSTSMIKAGHAYNREQREITYSWMLQWTGNDASGFWEKDTALEKEENLWAAPGGSVFNKPGSIRDNDLVLEYLREHKAEWGKIKTMKAAQGHRTKISTLIKEVLNTDLDNINLKSEIRDKKNVGDITVRQFILKPEPGIILPGVLLEPLTDNLTRDVILYIHEKGKAGILKDLNLVTDMLRSGYSICAVDLRGIGETSPDMAGKFWDFLSGKPIFGQRVRDVLAIIHWLKGAGIKAGDIKLWGTGMCALYGAFAGVANDDISGFILEDPLISFESIVEADIPGYNHEILLPGILEKFDMPQIYQALCPRPVLVLNPFSGDKTPAERSEIEKTDGIVSKTYQGLNNNKLWSIQKVSRDERIKIIRNNL